VASAIFELRYAGRKVADVIDLMLKSDWRSDQEVREKIKRYIADAIEDCIKAKHDAIDSMVVFVTTWFYELEERIGVRRLQEIFPEYLDVTARIASIQEDIAASREERHEARDSVYDRIEATGYDDVLKLYDKMRLSRERIEEISRVEAAEANRIANVEKDSRAAQASSLAMAERSYRVNLAMLAATVIAVLFAAAAILE